MSYQPYRELNRGGLPGRLAAAVYASYPIVFDFVWKTGKIPGVKLLDGVDVKRRILRERGLDFKLTAGEKVVYNAMIRNGGFMLIPAFFVFEDDLKKERE